MLTVELGVAERQLDGVADLFDLWAEAADVAVVDVGSLLQEQVLDLRALDVLEGEPAAQVGEDGVPDAQARVTQRGGDAQHPLVVGAGDDEDARLVDDLLDGHELPGLLVAAGLHGDEGLVEAHLLARAQRAEGQGGRGGHTQPAAAGEDVDLAGGHVDGEHRGEARRRAGHGLELLLHGLEPLARALQRRGETLVLRRETDRLLLELLDPVGPEPVHPRLGHHGPFPARLPPR